MLLTNPYPACPLPTIVQTAICRYNSRVFISIFQVAFMTSAAQRVLQHFQESIAAKQQCAEQLAEPTARAAALLLDSLMADGKILVCGNGGSAADAQHFAAELTGRFEKERMPLGAIALTTDTSALTAIGNDYAFDQIFARQVSALGRPGDVLVAISTSGNSGNVLAAIEAAREQGMSVVALTGRDGGKIAGVLAAGDVLLNVPHQRTARIQEIHILLIHALCDHIDTALFEE